MADVPEKQWNPEQLREVIARAERLLGHDLDDLVATAEKGRRSVTPPKYPYKFVQSLLLLRRAVDEPESTVVQNAASIAVVEVDGLLHAFDAWSDDPAFPEFQRAVKDPAQFLHAVTALVVASALKEHHPGVTLVASSSPGRSPDLAVTVTDQHELAVEVKTIGDLSANTLDSTGAIKIVQKTLKDAGTGDRGQLAPGRPAMLVVGGFGIDDITFDRLADAAEFVFSRAHGTRSHLLGIVINRFFFDIRIAAGRLQVVLCQETRIRRNPHYTGRLRLEGDWAEDWHLAAV